MSFTATAGSGGRAREPLGAHRSCEERLLLRYHGGDLAAREQLVNRLLPLAKRLAGRYRHSGESQEDLEQVACIGLIKAIDRYQSDQGSLLAYAVPTIVGELRRHFRDKGWSMRVPRSIQERLLQVNSAVDQLSGELGRSPTPTDVAEHSELSMEEVLEALEASTAYSLTALDAPYTGDEEGERTLADTLGAEDSGYAAVELGHALTPAFRALPVARRPEVLRDAQRLG